MRRIYVLLAITMVIAALGAGCTSRSASEGKPQYPTKPITAIVPWEAGSTTDTQTRPLFEIAQKKLGQPIVVVNKPGAAGLTGYREIHDAKPDGYTIGVTGAFHLNKLQGIFEYDHHDYDMIIIASTPEPAIMVTGKSQWRSVDDVVKYAKDNPGKLKVTTTSIGGWWWLGTKVFERDMGIKLNIIPQPGGGGMVVTQVAGGQIEIGISGAPEAKTQLKAGNLRLLGVMGAGRLPGFEDIPTLKELGKNVVFPTSVSVVAPKGLPSPVYERLVQVFKEAAQDPEYKNALASLGTRVAAISGQEAVKFLDKQAQDLKPILEEVKK